MPPEGQRTAGWLASSIDGRGPSAVVWAGSALVLGSGLVHVHLWDIAYRHVATLGPLFLVQAAASVLTALGLAVTRRRVLALGAVALMLGTILGFVLVLTTGLFGFKLHQVTGWADLALGSEAGAVVLLGLVERHTWSVHPHDQSKAVPGSGAATAA